MSKIKQNRKIEINNNYESESDDDLSTYESNVDVGLLIETDKDQVSENELKLNRMLLTSPFFPCKVGGRPAWLDYASVSNANLQCDTCDQSLTFLLQIYAPISTNDRLADKIEDLDDVFHRTLYVFICSHSGCKKPGIRVLRSQLRHDNEFYSQDPPPEISDDDSDSACLDDLERIGSHLADFYKHMHERKLLKFCNVCGLPSSKRCVKCSISFYCSQEHQVHDWSKLNHKLHCAEYVNHQDDMDTLFKCIVKNEYSAAKLNASSFQFPEYELCIEPECLDDVKLAAMAEKKLKVNEKKIIEEMEDSMDNGSAYEKDLDDLKENEQDKTFEKFRKFTQHEPTQVVRYERDGKPLWVTKHDKLRDDDNSIPACQNCGAKRIFEFQINPQLLSYLKLEESQQHSNTIDWAGLYIYTCSRSCTSSSYLNEYVYKQDFV